MRHAYGLRTSYSIEPGQQSFVFRVWPGEPEKENSPESPALAGEKLSP